MADAFDFEQSPVDLSADVRQIRQVGQSLVDAKIPGVAERAFSPATASFFEVLLQVEVFVVDLQDWDARHPESPVCGTAPAFSSSPPGRRSVARDRDVPDPGCRGSLLRRTPGRAEAGRGAPKIHGELLKIGFEVAERTVARYLRHARRRGDPGRRWLAFLANHREVIVAMDFFTVPTLSFQLRYYFFVIEHGRRTILHFNVTPHPTSDWVVQQLRQTFPEAGPYRYIILDRDSKFDAEVMGFLQATGLKTKRTRVRAPWQNGTAERWVGSCRREILDHVIALSESQLRRLVRDYVTFYHNDRRYLKMVWRW
jgi:transposase InsO family protein